MKGLLQLIVFIVGCVLLSALLIWLYSIWTQASPKTPPRELDGFTITPIGRGHSQSCIDEKVERNVDSAYIVTLTLCEDRIEAIQVIDDIIRVKTEHCTYQRNMTTSETSATGCRILSEFQAKVKSLF